MYLPSASRDFCHNRELPPLPLPPSKVWQSRHRCSRCSGSGNNLYHRPPPVVSKLQPVMPTQSPETAPPPMKKPRKWRNEIKLLRDCGEISVILLSPPPSRGSPPSPPPPSLPSPLSTSIRQSSQPAPPSDPPPPETPELLKLEPTLLLLELAILFEMPAMLPSTALSPVSPPPAAPPSAVPPSPPSPRVLHQAGWNLCKTCRKHYHHKSYYYCWFVT